MFPPSDKPQTKGSLDVWRLVVGNTAKRSGGAVLGDSGGTGSVGDGFAWMGLMCWSRI